MFGLEVSPVLLIGGIVVDQAGGNVAAFQLLGSLQQLVAIDGIRQDKGDVDAQLTGLLRSQHAVADIDGGEEDSLTVSGADIGQLCPEVDIVLIGALGAGDGPAGFGKNICEQILHAHRIRVCHAGQHTYFGDSLIDQEVRQALGLIVIGETYPEHPVIHFAGLLIDGTGGVGGRQSDQRYSACGDHRLGGGSPSTVSGAQDGDALILLDHLSGGGSHFFHAAGNIIGDQLYLVTQPAAVGVDLVQIVLHCGGGRNAEIIVRAGDDSQMSNFNGALEVTILLCLALWAAGRGRRGARGVSRSAAGG